MTLTPRQRARKLLPVALIVCAAVAALAIWHQAKAAEELPACNATTNPPLLIVLPDGTEIPAARIVYDLDARRVEIIGYARVFCDGLESLP